MAKKTGVDFKRFDRIVAQIGGKRNSPEIQAAYRQWGIRYLAWTKKLFVKNSGGGGEWKPLKRKRKRGSLASAKILRDTGTLLKALTVGAAGNLFKVLSNGVQVGFGGPTRHPEGKMSIADIAKAHQNGEGNLPKRKILHAPDQTLIRQMLGDLARAYNKLGRKK